MKSFIQQPVYIITVILLLVVFSEWLSKKKIFHRLGSSLIIILSAAIIANAGLIPSAHNAPPLYSGIFEYAAILGIFFLLLDVRLKDLKLAGLPMLTMFLIGSLSTVTGVVAGYYLISPQHHGIAHANAVAGMYTGTYSGGSANLNAVAIEYGVNKDGVLFAAINAVDNIVGTIWIMLTLILPVIIQRLIPRKRTIPPEISSLSDEELRDKLSLGAAKMTITDFALLLTLGFGSFLLSALLATYVPQIPSILTITTLALIWAQVPFVQKLKGSNVLGYLLILIFLAVIGAYCDLNALSHSGEIAITLLLWVATMILIHGVFIFLIGGLLKQDWDIIAIASNANVGGTATAAVCATSLGRTDLQLPGLLAGSLGNAIGTYLGIMVAELLK
jgi:uncharacterized membrane protein